MSGSAKYAQVQPVRHLIKTMTTVSRVEWEQTEGKRIRKEKKEKMEKGKNNTPIGRHCNN